MRIRIERIGIIAFVIVLLSFTDLKSQVIEKLDSTNYDEIIRNLPAFSIFGDNYFVTGTAIGETPTQNNSDVKFQLGFKHRLTNLMLPWNTFLFFTYRQKSFWDVYRESLPFRETNFNPGLGVAKLFFKNNRLSGGLWFQVEHESNGREEPFSRSWNYVSLLYIKSVSEQVKLRGKIWAPFGDLSDNPDITNFRGFQELGITYLPSRKVILEGDFRTAFINGIKGSARLSASIKIFESTNQYLFIQYFLGYSEDLINYNVSVSRLRVGIAFKDLLYVLS